MASWFRNIQGHLTDFANEVFDEATEEVTDPDSELQVLKKKYMEIEKQLKLEQENNEMLNKKQAILEDQIYSKELEIESLNSKYGIMIESRDTQIRSLQVIIFMLSILFLLLFLQIFADALRANLIEYEERYELCKAENAETVQQLEKLSIDFDRLRASFEDEVEKLRIELDASKIDRERLRADVEKFRSAIGSIDEELNKLRESNERLARDNRAMGESLDKFNEIRDMLERKNSLSTQNFNLRISRDKEKALRECERLREHLVTVEDTSTKEAVMAEEREVALRAKIKELELQIHESADSAISSTSVLQVYCELIFLNGFYFKTTTSFSDNQIALSNLQKVFQDIRLEYDLEIIEELETQLSERIAVYSTNSVSQIDHEILKQLFLSYFTAQPNKKPEIAMLLASILGYKEEVSKLSRTNSSSRYAANKISLAEQFIRFLENESVTSATSHSLPIEVRKFNFILEKKIFKFFSKKILIYLLVMMKFPFISTFITFLKIFFRY
ncbi:unnamed protein product [Dracunculus medinensis]|uniref:GRIP domain-containing protein n=1 Tax=Dracunculus medinensis TaxID=318479 RepID=A0A158Q2S4_DRAME|nr:unnamed protein product [Dracunculus medinensis]